MDEPREYPILFKGPLVRAILEGRKTQTRRLGEARWKKGDRLWVRETFYCDHFDYPNAPIEAMGSMLHYRADFDPRAWEAGSPDDVDGDGRRSAWRPSIHMPRWACRLTLRVAEVRDERLQDISGADVLAEGVDNGRSNPTMGQRWETMQRIAFAVLWDSIAKPGKRWADNPPVSVTTFEPEEQSHE